MPPVSCSLAERTLNADGRRGRSGWRTAWRRGRCYDQRRCSPRYRFTRTGDDQPFVLRRDPIEPNTRTTPTIASTTDSPARQRELIVGDRRDHVDPVAVVERRQGERRHDVTEQHRQDRREDAEHADAEDRVGLPGWARIPSTSAANPASAAIGMTNDSTERIVLKNPTFSTGIVTAATSETA